MCGGTRLARARWVVSLSWREVDFGGVVVAGLIAGYVMQLAGMWAGKVPGLVAVDIADFGRRYMVSDRPSAWLLGFFSHLANSVILTLVWASLMAPNLGWPPVLEGLLFGELVAVVLAGGLVAPLAGLGLMGRRTGSARFAFTSLAMHAVWGALVGLVYTGS